MIYKISDGCVHCHVRATSEEEALLVDSVLEYFVECEAELTVKALAKNSTLSITMEIVTIIHTAEEWNYIYEGCPPMMIGSSEY